MGLLQMSFDG